MPSKTGWFLLGAAGGAAVALAIVSLQSHGTIESIPNPDSPATNRVTELESTLQSTRSQLARSETRNQDLARRIEKLSKEQAAATATASSPPAGTASKPKGFAALFGGDGTNGMSDAMEEMMKTAITQQIDGKISGMKAKLNLTPEQEAAVREILTGSQERGMGIAKKMLNGEMSQDEMKDYGKGALSEDEQIKAVLTPEQADMYGEYQKEERTRMARLIANSELMQLQSSLNLSEAEQDKVFAVLAEQAQDQFTPSTNSSPLDYRGQMARKLEALRSVLTPDQFTRYQKFQEQQLKLIESFMPGITSNGTSHTESFISVGP